MVSGADFIFYFQAGIIIAVYFVLIHVFYQQDYSPINLFIFSFGLLSIQLTNFLLFALFDNYFIMENSMIIIIGPIIEELVKIGILLHLIARNSSMTVREFAFQGAILGLGFATGELLGYAINFGANILITRSVLIIFGHPLFGSLLAISIYMVSRSFKDRVDTLEKISKRSYFIIIPLTVLLHNFWNWISITFPSFLAANVLLHTLIWYGVVKFSKSIGSISFDTQNELIS